MRQTVLVSAIVLVLVIGAQSVYGRTELDSSGKPIIFTDEQDRPCTFGPNKDECLYQHLEKIPGTTNYADYQSGYKIGLADGLAGEPYHHAKTDDANVSWGDGYTHGWNKGMVQWGTSHGVKNPQENADLLADASTP